MINFSHVWWFYLYLNTKYLIIIYKKSNIYIFRLNVFFFLNWNHIDKDIDSWMFMNKPWFIFTILSIYLIFVLKIGPEFMKYRKPLNLKLIILIYNAIQTVYNGWLVCWVSLHTYIKLENTNISNVSQCNVYIYKTDI